MIPNVPQRLIVDDAQGLRLVATRCEDCDAMMFPAQDSCARCGSERVGDTPLPARGTLWSFTVQTFRPPAPPFAAGSTGEKFPHFGVGMVEFVGGLCVQGRLAEADPRRLRIGMTMETVLVPVDGSPAESIYAFRSVSGEAV